METRVRKRIKVIAVAPAAVRELQRRHGASEVGVYNALAYRSNSERAERIRIDALDNFQGLVTTKFIYTKV